MIVLRAIMLLRERKLDTPKLRQTRTSRSGNKTTRRIEGVKAHSWSTNRFSRTRTGVADSISSRVHLSIPSHHGDDFSVCRSSRHDYYVMGP
jgi:hypothetical protein